MMVAKVAFLTALAVPVFYFDIRYKRIPNWVSLGGWALYGLVLTAAARNLLPGFLLGSFLAGGSYLLIHLLSKGRLGMGDVKLALSLGGVSGIVGWYFTNLFASLTALLLFFLLLLLKKANFRSRIPFGPFLCAGGIAHQVLKGCGVLA